MCGHWVYNNSAIIAVSSYSVVFNKFSASYIVNEFQKLDIYKRIAGIENQTESDDMKEELLDSATSLRSLSLRYMRKA